ncbi:dynein regulatory complex subunit 2-like isoform X2 [Trachinotus anak]|uniref:dynein regulatory complex subunit 2-like isoform X2 n=1 Tax=Trachinotus anak TaxID=443729 RepID=UPI0039F1C5B0
METLQQRAQTEEEMAKKREETLAQFLKDKLEREERNTAANLHKLNEAWRAILRQTKGPELRAEITTFRQTFERQMDGLDSDIKDLACDLQERARLSTRGRQVHLQRLELFGALHEKRMVTVQQHWENCMQLLSSRFISEGKQMLAHSQQQQAHLEDTTHIMVQQYEEVMDKIHKLYNDCFMAYKSSLQETGARKKKSLSSTHRGRRAQGAPKKALGDVARIQEVLQFCQKKKVEREAREKQYSEQTAENMEEAKEVQLIVQLRRKLNSSKTENRAKEEALAAASNKVNKKTDKLRKQLNQGRSAASKQFIDLSVQSNSAAKKLQAAIAKGERVLRVAEMCRKLESKHQKVLSSLSSAADSEKSAAEKKEQEKTFQFPALQQRMTIALLVQDVLKKQKEDLRKENQQLRRQLQQQLDDMSVSDNTLDGRHAPLTISRAPTTTAPPDTCRLCNITKAVDAIKHTASPKKS